MASPARGRAPTGYSAKDYPPFAVTADLVILTIRNGELCVLLIRRGKDPFAGAWALPGGFVDIDEGLEVAARRELAEETGVDDPALWLEQLGTWGEPGRDPRMRVVSVAWLALAADLPEPDAGDDASEAEWVTIADALRSDLAFDHKEILSVGLERARAKLEYSTLATEFCGDEFTIGQLRSVYEIVWGHPLDPRNFHRKVMKTDGFVVATGAMSEGGPGRPATVYRAGPAASLHPPLTRDA